LIDVPIKDLGISRVWLVQDKPLRPDFIDPDANLLAEGGTTKGFAEAMGLTTETPAAVDPAADPAAAAAPQSKIIEVKRYDFVVQFCWQPNTRTARRAIAATRAEAEKAAAEAAAAAPEEGAPADEAAAQ
jgi:hypothetical protein